MNKENEKIYTAYYKSPLGLLKIICSDNAIRELSFAKADEKNAEIPQCDMIKKVFTELDEYFAGRRTSFDDLPLESFGTPFQERVWAALREIPYGETCSYKDIAIKAGNEKACRAVGMANHNNPIAIIVPCHRVIGAKGEITGYAGGIEAKEFLLRLENGGKTIKEK